MDRDLGDLASRESGEVEWPDVAPVPAEANGSAATVAAGVKAAGAESTCTADEAGDGVAAPEVVQGYLAPALRAAAAARARAARIRSGQHVRESRAPMLPARFERIVPPPEPERPSPGLTVAQAAAASIIAFKPRPRASNPGPRAYRTEYLPFQDGGPDWHETTDAAPNAATPEPRVMEVTGPDHQPVDPDDQPMGPTTGERGRFARTLAALQRCEAGVQPPEPWAQVVPRPSAARHGKAVPEPPRAAPSNSLGLLWRYMKRNEEVEPGPRG